MRAPRDEHGAIGGVEGLAFGVLVFVFGTLMVVNAWGVVDAKIAASAAAREAVRAYVEAPSESEGRAAAETAARGTAAGHNRLPVRLSLVAGEGGAQFERCAPVEATVTIDVPRLALPAIGGAGGFIEVTGRHVEVIDPYRSGIGGTPTCTM